MPYFVAVDLGATSGRTILASIDDKHNLSIEEINRFPNKMINHDGHLYWNIHSLFENIKEGLTKVAIRGITPDSIGIDTWGVDFACFAVDGSLIGLPRAYRDSLYNGAAIRFSDKVMSSEELYMRTGIQQMDFNTVYQFNELRDSLAMQTAAKIAFTPDALAYLLTGRHITEYTIASTSALLNPTERNFDAKILESVSLTADKFGELVQPGTIIGKLRESVSAETGMATVSVVAVAGHDTASAVVAVPAEDSCFAFLSSGTWSLMGIESAVPVINEFTYTNNITNEGGVDGTVRLLKNITGMWIIEQCLAAWRTEGYDYSYPEMVRMAETASEFTSFIDPDDAAFTRPANMPDAICDYCRRTGQSVPRTHAEIIRLVFESLALKYRWVLTLFTEISFNDIKRLHVIGGGSRNNLLNQFTADAIGLPVIAGPAEATAIGNVMMQAKACGIVSSLAEMRSIIAENTDVTIFYPADREKWQEAYYRYEKIITK